MRIVQIVPRLPPAICGVGDYARLLAGAMQPHGVETRFVVTDSTWQGETSIDGHSIEQLPQASSASLLQVLEGGEAGAVLLHFVGYAYERTGCPWWLLEGLEPWKQRKKGRHLVTMFHELYASGPPWTRAFWTLRAQKAIGARLANLSDQCSTSMEMIAGRIARLAPQKTNRVRVAPVFSTVGEPSHVAPLSERKRHMVVFGSAGWRRDAYTRHREVLIHACRQLQVERILDVGRPLEEEINLPLPVDRLGMLSAEDLSPLLSESLAGFVTYPEAFLAKSTIFAAYCAHGMVPLVCGRRGSNTDGLTPNDTFCRAYDIPQIQSLQETVISAHTWYRQHTLELQAAQTVAQIGRHHHHKDTEVLH